jgi:hypothetical protein
MELWRAGIKKRHWKSPLTRSCRLPYSPGPRRTPRAGRAESPRDVHRETGDQQTTWIGSLVSAECRNGAAPQRLALARMPAIRYDTLPDARPLPLPPRRPVRRPPARKRYCVQSLPEE